MEVLSLIALLTGLEFFVVRFKVFPQPTFIFFGYEYFYYFSFSF